MKKAVFILIITISFTTNTLLSMDFSSNNSFNTSKEVKVNAQVTSKDQEINKSFHKIASLKYDVKKCNCKHKSNAFADVLTKKGAKNVYLITIEHGPREYSHMVVSWEGRVYDTTITPPVYGIDEKEYLNKIKKYGFTGLQVKAPYSSNRG
ncbi:hypothetical protein [Methanobacterium sp.]|jgi:uncharacterized membrane protein|uniref:hypothetical protein n=1 Tax=Methanobacterium sp. TaxID=2164 RepID=UPI00315976DE